MAAGEYLKVAAASLHRAADSLKQQAKEMQAHLTRTQLQTKSLVDKNALEIKAKEAERMGINDEGKRSYLSIQIQKLQNEIIAAEHELKQVQENIQNAASAKLSQSEAIESQARRLEGQASSVD